MGLLFHLTLAALVALNEPPDALLTWAKPLKGTRICVDPGHGGQPPSPRPRLFAPYTGGAWGAATCQTESDVNLRVACTLACDLQAMGAEVCMTRNTDARVTSNPGKRAELEARSAIASMFRADIFVSVHHNWSPRPTVNYSAVFHHPGAGETSRRLARSVAGEVRRMLPHVPSAGAVPGDFCVLRTTRMPSMLIEFSFMSNPEEDTRLVCPDYNAVEARAAARGIAIGVLRERVENLVSRITSSLPEKKPESRSKVKRAKRR